MRGMQIRNNTSAIVQSQLHLVKKEPKVYLHEVSVSDQYRRYQPDQIRKEISGIEHHYCQAVLHVNNMC